MTSVNKLKNFHCLLSMWMSFLVKFMVVIYWLMAHTMSFSIMTFSIMPFSIMTLSMKALYVTLSITMFWYYPDCRVIHYCVEHHYAGCRYAECRYAERHCAPLVVAPKTLASKMAHLPCVWHLITLLFCWNGLCLILFTQTNLILFDICDGIR